jgi:hypothetical protein
MLSPKIINFTRKSENCKKRARIHFMHGLTYFIDIKD